MVGAYGRCRSDLTGFVHDAERHIGAIDGTFVRDLGTATDISADWRVAIKTNDGAIFPVSGARPHRHPLRKRQTHRTPGDTTTTEAA